MFPTATSERAGLAFAPVLLLCALSAGLIVQSVLPTLRPTASASWVKRAHSSVREISAPEPVAPYPAILLHPLFNPSRAPVDADSGVQAAPVGAITLVGAASAAGQASAILRDAAGELRTLRLGESLDGWRLAEVGHGAATLTRNGRIQSLILGAAPIIPPVASSTAAR